jgi:hypothetical protein
MMKEGSGAGSESIPLTNGSGSGSGRPKIMWIRWIRIRNIALLNVLREIPYGGAATADTHFAPGDLIAGHNVPVNAVRRRLFSFPMV